MELSENANEDSSRLFQPNDINPNSASAAFQQDRIINMQEQDIPIIEEVTIEIDSSVTTSRTSNSNEMEVDLSNNRADHRENQNIQNNDQNKSIEDSVKINGCQLVDTSEEMDSGALCSICYSPYTNSGEHRLSCLKCGHLFGNSCILHWLKTGCQPSARRCPSCNEKAATRDIRILYAKNLIAYDTTEKDRLLEKLNNVQSEKNKLESQLNSSNLKIEMLQNKILLYEKQIKELSKSVNHNEKALFDQEKNYSFSSKCIQTFNLSSESGCRVLAYSSYLSLLLATQPSTNPLFPGFGIRKINPYDMRLSSFHLVHKKSIRDMSFSPHNRSNLLSVSLDCSAKLFDVQSNSVIQSFSVSEPLWSCCWSTTDMNKFFCGSQCGNLFAFDRRQPSGETEIISQTANSTDKSAILSLCYIPPRPNRFMPTGGILACRFNCIAAFFSTNQKFQNTVFPIEGTFMSMRYNEYSDHLLISARANSKFTSTRHIVCQLSNLQPDECQKDIINVLHTFHGPRNLNNLSRSVLVPLRNDDQLICAYNSRLNNIDAWSMMTEKKLDIKENCFSEPINDICSFQVNDKEIILPCLSEKKLFFIQLNFTDTNY